MATIRTFKHKPFLVEGGGGGLSYTVVWSHPDRPVGRVYQAVLFDITAGTYLLNS